MDPSIIKLTFLHDVVSLLHQTLRDLIEVSYVHNFYFDEITEEKDALESIVRKFLLDEDPRSWNACIVLIYC